MNVNPEQQSRQTESVAQQVQSTEVKDLTPQQQEAREQIDSLKKELETLDATVSFSKKTSEILYKGLMGDPSIKDDPEAKPTIIMFEKFKKIYEKAAGEQVQTKNQLADLVSMGDKIEHTAGIDMENGKVEELKYSSEDMKDISNKEFLSLQPEERLQYITTNNIDSENIASGDVKNLEFTFTFDGEFNKDFYMLTTAGQVLPKEVSNVTSGGKDYIRDGIAGEFFTSGGERLTIHESTNLTVTSLLDKDKIGEINTANKNIVDGFINEKPEYSKYSDVLTMGIEKLGIEKDLFEFLIKLVGNKLDGLNTEGTTDTLSERSVKLEQILTSINRSRGEDYTDFSDSEFRLELLKEFTSDWKTEAVSLGFKEEEVKSFSTVIETRKKYENLDPSVNIEGLSEGRKRIVGAAMEAYENGDIMGAGHCTDWVDKVFKKSVGKSVYDSNTSFNGVKSSDKGTGLGVREYAGKDDIGNIGAGDHIILDKPRSGRYGIGRTHSVIALGEPVDGMLKVVSYPNSKIPPRVEMYDLYGQGRGQKNGKPIRIQGV